MTRKLSETLEMYLKTILALEREFNPVRVSQIAKARGVSPASGTEAIQTLQEKGLRRLKAYQAWLKMKEPKWPNVKYPQVDFQEIHYYSAPKSAEDGPKSMDEVDPEIRRTFDKLGIPLEEQMRLSGIAVDAVCDSVSGATTVNAKLAE